MRKGDTRMKADEHLWFLERKNKKGEVVDMTREQMKERAAAKYGVPVSEIILIEVKPEGHLEAQIKGEQDGKDS